MFENGVTEAEEKYKLDAEKYQEIVKRFEEKLAENNKK